MKECTCNMTYMTWTFLLLGNDTMMFETVVKKNLKCHGHLFLFLCQNR